ncbi:MAG: hypothetical protein IPL37_08530 [Austwickia sp.]|nr:hypothetical protein [Austwickia sp.]
MRQDVTVAGLAESMTAAAGVSGEFVTVAGDPSYRITRVNLLDPFLMTVVGAGDVWMFLSSAGGLTAGRGSPDAALLPYYTEDKLNDHAHCTGGLTLIRCANDAGDQVLWEPFARSGDGHPHIQRSLVKSLWGDRVTFEETHAELGLTFSVRWRTSQRFGIVRTCRLSSQLSSQHSGQPGARSVELVDGLVNLLPGGTSATVQNRLSNLLDAYKRTEVDPDSGVVLAWLNSALTDLAEPSESLVATVAWQHGLTPHAYLLSEQQLPAYRRGQSVSGEYDVRGRRHAYLVATSADLGPGQDLAWSMAADTPCDAAQVADLTRWLATESAERIGEVLAADAAAGRAALHDIVAAADGVQDTADQLACVHHRANVLFNVMRGGAPVAGHQVDRADVLEYLRLRNRVLLERRRGELDRLPQRLSMRELVAWADETGCPDLRRLARGFLSLTFSRRHGDPSRPWNWFEIRLGREGRAPVAYQGNWRDIFQNWEALAWSYPECLEAMISTFLGATTLDGYNPYRISHDGVDWEVPEPENPWSNIGYWSDHQIVYLMRLLEASERFWPGRLADLLQERIFGYADVPYRIASYADIVRDPQQTITFDVERDTQSAARVRELGGDGRLVRDEHGDLVLAGAGEKLILLLAAKVVNLVPMAGLWMNTQRPEWNDANNALVGRGLSVVTVAHLRRYTRLLRGLLDREIEVSDELAALVEQLSDILRAPDIAASLVPGAPAVTDAVRRAVLDRLGRAGERYRTQAYSGLSGRRRQLSTAQVHGLLDIVCDWCDATVRANRRPDGLYHSYNTLELSDGAATVGHLTEMLEGQVAVLSCGALTSAESLDLLGALRASALYRPDRHSYQLYPDRELPRFLERNTVTLGPDDAAAAALFGALAGAADRSLVVRDDSGGYHFAPGIRNAADVAAVLEGLAANSPQADLARAAGPQVQAVFERVFRHRQFTGRSGTFFAYEGLGSVYWHMVAKLLLAVQECHEGAVLAGESAQVLDEFAQRYEDIRTGLGYCRTPQQYGAFPTDPYSHSPAGQGARQPGMTGQVKEEILTRLAELGLRVTDGRITFAPQLLRAGEWRNDHTLEFTFCDVPIHYRVDPDAPHLEVAVVHRDGTRRHHHDGRIDHDDSRRIFARDGSVLAVEVSFRRIPDGPVPPGE